MNPMTAIKDPDERPRLFLSAEFHLGKFSILPAQCIFHGLKSDCAALQLDVAEQTLKSKHNLSFFTIFTSVENRL